MAEQSKHGISWATTTWNPVTGCTPASEGCANCYAKRMHERFNDKPFSEVTMHPDRLEQPLHWRKPRRIFVCSMSDLFHKEIPTYFQEKVFRTAISASQHTFLILTKRANNMNWRIPIIMDRIYGFHDSWMMPENIWLGVTVENQRTADERIPLLLQTPAAKRFVSFEPLLGLIDLTNIAPHDALDTPDPRRKLSWVICGGETGPGARPMNLEWTRSIIEQCKAAGVAIHVKQIPVNGKVSKNMAEWPAEFRVRE